MYIFGTSKYKDVEGRASTYIIDYIFNMSINDTLTTFGTLSIRQNVRYYNQGKYSEEIFKFHLGLESKKQLEKNCLYCVLY